MVFLVVKYRCESWTIKKAKSQRTDAFKLWCWGRLLRVPWTARRANQSILNEINPEYSLGGLILKPKLWPPDAKSQLTKKDRYWEGLKAKGEGRWQRMRWLDGITDLTDINLSKLWEIVEDKKPGVLQPTGSQRVRLT